MSSYKLEVDIVLFIIHIVIIIYLINQLRKKNE